jgi:hypothetical protein
LALADQFLQTGPGEISQVLGQPRINPQIGS